MSEDIVCEIVRINEEKIFIVPLSNRYVPYIEVCDDKTISYRGNNKPIIQIVPNGRTDVEPYILAEAIDLHYGKKGEKDIIIGFNHNYTAEPKEVKYSWWKIITKKYFLPDASKGCGSFVRGTYLYIFEEYKEDDIPSKETVCRNILLNSFGKHKPVKI